MDPGDDEGVARELRELVEALGIPPLAETVTPVSAEPLIRIMRHYGADAGDPVRSLFGVLGDKWSGLLLHLLAHGPVRFAELRRQASGAAGQTLSERILALKLREMERDGLISRHEEGTAPLKVDYELTALGRGFLILATRMSGWILFHTEEILAARERFDGR